MTDNDAESSRGKIGWLARAAQTADRIAILFEPCGRRYFWLVSALVIGGLPVALSIWTNVPGHQLISALLLSALCLGLARTDRWIAGISAITVAFVAHSLVVILLVPNDRAKVDRLFPRAGEYWDKQQVWIKSGEDPEYELKNWVPAHVTLFAGTTLFSFSSFGVVTFHDGFVQVDMMNYYNAMMARESKSAFRSFSFGWHIWSMLRGIGYVFITFEMISLALQVCSRRVISEWKTRRWRWLFGIVFLVMDGLIKAFALEAVRVRLFENLL